MDLHQIRGQPCHEEVTGIAVTKVGKGKPQGRRVSQQRLPWDRFPRVPGGFPFAQGKHPDRGKPEKRPDQPGCAGDIEHCGPSPHPDNPGTRRKADHRGQHDPRQGKTLDLGMVRDTHVAGDPMIDGRKIEPLSHSDQKPAQGNRSDAGEKRSDAGKQGSPYHPGGHAPVRPKPVHRHSTGDHEENITGEKGRKDGPHLGFAPAEGFHHERRCDGNVDPVQKTEDVGQEAQKNHRPELGLSVVQNIHQGLDKVGLRVPGKQGYRGKSVSFNGALRRLFALPPV